MHTPEEYYAIMHAPHGEEAITASRESPSGGAPSVVKAMAEYHLGRYARWTDPAGTLKALANVNGSTAADAMWHQSQPKAWNSVYQGSARVERMGAELQIILL